jgi:glycosyltransferase involved in cell wall biosynthesis
MRLVHYYPRALVGDGGPTRAMWQWAVAAHTAGCRVAILCDAGLQASESPLRNPLIPTIPLDHVVFGGIRIPRRLSRALGPDDILLLHSTYIPGNVVAACVARRVGIPYIVMPHGGYDGTSRARRRVRKALWQPIERTYLERALGVHLFFDTEAPDAARVAPKARWIVAPTGCDFQKTAWDGGTGRYLAWFGRYDIRHKGLDLLVSALKRLDHRVPLRLHGRSSEDSREDVHQLVAAAGVADLVTVGGPVTGSEKVRFLCAAAAYVHPSRWESHSQALVEALAHGVPSVVSASCSIAPELRAADAAILVEPTPEAIAHGVSAILDNPRYYSQRAQLFVGRTLAWPGIVQSYLDQIDVLRRAGAGPSPHKG